MQKDWENFWQRNQDSRFIGPSWSKRRIMAILRPYLADSPAVLDAGSGSGFFSSFFISHGCETYSLDYSEEALSMTREETGGRSAAYLLRDLLDKAFAREHARQFDLVFSDGLFEHFDPTEQDRIFEHFKIVQKPGGIIATFVPNRYSFWTLIRPLFMPGIAEKPFTLNGLKLLYLRNGCSIIEKGGINVLPFKRSPDTLLGSRFGMLVYAVGQ
jgi:SAM-dependent methyltransferase